MSTEEQIICAAAFYEVLEDVNMKLRKVAKRADFAQIMK